MYVKFIDFKKEVSFEKEGEAMGKDSKEFERLKRRAYLIILPFILLSSSVTFFMRLYHEQYGFELYINALFILVFIMGWVAAYFNYGKRVSELLILILLLIYYWLAVYLTIQSHIADKELIGNSMFIIWLPLLLMYIFGVFTKRKAIGISVTLLIASVLPVLLYFKKLDGSHIEMFVQLYIATIIYIFIIIYAFKLFETYLENRFLSQQFYLDTLTQIGNRYQINQWMMAYLQSAKDFPFSIIFFDIDRFKEINDQFGHLIGDEVLQEVAAVIQSKAEGYHFGRWGGEEFVLLVPISECEAFTMAESLREALEQHVFKEVGQVTASFGVTSFEEGDTVHSLLKRVDEKLYESKRGGRNRVTGKF